MKTSCLLIDLEICIRIQYRRFVASVSKRLQATGNTPSGGSKGDTGGMLFKEERELLTKGVTTAPTVNVDKVIYIILLF